MTMEPIEPTPWPREVPPRVPGWPDAEPYSVLEFRLDEARDQEEVNYPGDNITAATNGTLAGISIKFQSKRNKSIPLDQFNPVSYPSGFGKFYITNTEQENRKLYIFIGRAAGAAAPTVSFAASQIVKVSGQTVFAKVSGEGVPIYGYDYMSGEYRIPYVDASGEIKIAVTVADIVIAKVSGEAAPIYGYYALSGDQREVHVDASGELKIHVTVADIVTAKISGETVVIGKYMPVAPTLGSGAVSIVRADVTGRLIAAVSGETVIAKISGETVTVASGAYVQVSGQMIEVASGQTVIAKISGETVTVASGAYVQVSGQMVEVASGQTVIAKVSGETVTVASGAYVQVSGQMIAVASGAFVLISGQQVIAKVSGEVVKISGETVDIQVPTAVKTGAIEGPTAASGGTIVTSGAVKAATFKALSGNIFVGGTAEGDMPYLNYGFVLAESEAVSLDIDNFGRVRLCAETSGSWVSKIGVA